jgi:hypothetical protein
MTTIITAMSTVNRGTFAATDAANWDYQNAVVYALRPSSV